jgi:Family of unknown function (DUF6174)
MVGRPPRPGLRNRPAASALIAATLSASMALGIAGCSLLSVPASPGPGDVPASPGPNGGPAADLATHEARWRATGIDSYELLISFSCYFCSTPGAVRVSVVDGQVTAAVPADRALRHVDLSHYPLTIDAVYERARATLAGGGKVDVLYDEATGVPTTIAFDPVPQAIDDELEVSVESFAPATPDPS